MLKIQNGVVKVQPPEELLLTEKKNPIIFKVYCKKGRKIERVSEERIEQGLKPISQDITYLASGKKFGTIEVHFKNIETAQVHSVKSLETEDIILIPIYKGPTSN
uniref:Uncharacterized protein n=1 Tax=Octopus bimaculoides TaxID=37653 RepID=A0A0L8HLS8_OCTBM